MNLLLAVIDDLYTFARDSLVDLYHLFFEQHPVPRYELPSERLSRTDTADTQTPSAFKSTEVVLQERTIPQKNTVMYTGYEEAVVSETPAAAFDNIIARLPYGSMVMVLEQRGTWSRIVCREIAGWVESRTLSGRSTEVYPDFTIGEPNLADDPNTFRLRAVIRDEFGGGYAGLPLRASEYVLYRLYRKGVSVHWPDVRPRDEGTWHKILGGVSGMHMGVVPKDGAVMEYAFNGGMGHLAYIEAVFPDETISISEVNYPDAGVYNERVLTKEEWRELRPVFIEFS